LHTTLGLCVRRGIRRMSRPELQPNKVTKDENIFYCSSVLGQARTEDE